MNYWLFTCNPLRYPTVFEELEKNAINGWSVGVHLHEIKKDDKVAFWIGGKNDPGVYMFAEVRSPHPFLAAHYSSKNETANYVRFKNSESFPLHPVTLEILEKDESFRRILKYVRKQHRSPARLTAADWNFLTGAQTKAAKKAKNLPRKVLTDKEISHTISAEEKRINKLYVNRPTERIALITARSGQGRYKANLRKVEKICRITRTFDASFLVASHIKPWADSNDIEKVDGNNGLFLTPNLDRAFDRGYISFTSSGKILISKRLAKPLIKLLGISGSTNIGALNFGQQKYMKYHREKVFK